MSYGWRWRSIRGSMSADIIVSYDGTPNDDDAIALARLLAKAGATIALAYVRHAPEFDLRREELAEHDARRRLEQGAALLGDPGVARHVVLSPSTPEGLAKLAATERASVIVFGSDYRTPPGHAEPGTSAQNLLEGGPIAIAVAPAGLRTDTDAAIRTIGVVAAESDAGARRTAEALAARLGAAVTASNNGSADLTVVGSQVASTDGRIALSGATRSALDSARGSVLVLPTGTAALT
jgi:nucleotide-binding universal stress UspA family protein